MCPTEGEGSNFIYRVGISQCAKNRVWGMPLPPLNILSEIEFESDFLVILASLLH